MTGKEINAGAGRESSHAEAAKKLFYEGYNCAQAVVCAFSDVTGIDRERSARMASSFGGGLGRMREVCGTVSGAALALGIVCGYSDPGDKEAKKKHYERIRFFAEQFREAEGSIICAELLRKGSTDPEQIAAGGDPEERTAEYYRKRPCPELVYRAALILDEMLGECIIQHKD